jgi:hypothetical protein
MLRTVIPVSAASCSIVRLFSDFDSVVANLCETYH